MRRAGSFRQRLKPAARVATLQDQRVRAKTMKKVARLSHSSSQYSRVSRASSTLTILYQGESAQRVQELETLVHNLEVERVFDGDWELFRSLMFSIQARYNDNPFHNFYHGFSVANMATLFLLSPELQEDKVVVLPADYKLAFFVAALGHDIDHPGNDNFYEIKSNSKLAQVYAQQSVLENHHITTLLGLLDEETAEKTNLFQFLAHNRQTELREFMRAVVIGTDMTQHDRHRKTLESLKGKNLLHQLGNPEQKSKIMQAILHACDLSGQVLTLKLAANWEERIVEEMKRQAEKSAKEKVELPDFIETLVNGEWGYEARATIQLGFIDKFLLPLWKAVGEVFESMMPFHDHLKNVVRKYYQIMQESGFDAANVYFKENAEKLPPQFADALLVQ